jgi:sulfide dehydrogenase [flavocytochrome c] flavoprotein subunit
MLIKRRQLLEVGGGAGLLAGLGLSLSARGAEGARVVVIGGGFGGATCARYLKRLDPVLNVTLVERDSEYRTCPFSNLVLGGLKTMEDITHGYNGLRMAGVEVIHDEALDIDPAARTVSLAGGNPLGYDRLVVSPGIDLRFDAVEGYDEAAAEQMPHSWKAGPQTELLRGQLEAMDDGGVVIIAAPGNPYRCPPGPYERASLIAHYLKLHKPKSKILILDAKDSFSKQGLFMAGWEQLYPGMIEWVRGSDGGIVDAVDAARKTLVTEAGFTEQRGDVVNFIPPQRAAAIAVRADLADETGWCPVDQLSFESTRHAGVHVLGDASMAGAMPKSGFSANSQAKVCAAAIVAALHEQTLPPPSYANTCYSLVGPEYGISVSAVYRLDNGSIAGVEGAGGVSPTDADATFRSREATYARGWYESAMSDVFG